MLYVGMFECSETGDPLAEDEEAREKGLTLFECIVEAPNIENAEKKFKALFRKLKKENETFYDVNDIDLNSLVEFAKPPKEAILTQWCSVRKFGKSFATISTALLGSEFQHVEVFGMDSDDENNEDEPPFISFDEEEGERNPLYKDLLRRKQRGEELNFDDLSDGDLYQLYVIEGCINSEIADLFDIEPEKVAYRRRKIGATFDEKVGVAMADDPRVLAAFEKYTKSVIDSHNKQAAERLGE